MAQDVRDLAATEDGKTHDRNHFILITFLLHLNSLQRGSQHCSDCFVSSLLFYNTQ